MEYNRIVAVTGLPGLFEIVSSKNDGALVRSLEDKTTKFVSSRVHNLSHLESIEVYTVGDNANLADVFHAMKGSTEALPDVKDNKALKAYFEKVYPDVDFERVYSSDLKKMVKWYEVLQKNEVDIKLTEKEATEEETTETETPLETENVAEPVSVATEPANEEAPKEKKPKKKKTEE
ncbi:MAG TPA: DUF5606 domain-containing protein [Chitinophagaceae bacterium]|jgi:hypothetical protein|nr:DUF5606 domain-containing protein [Chitinophagaceae bacterium]